MGSNDNALVLSVNTESKLIKLSCSHHISLLNSVKLQSEVNSHQSLIEKFKLGN